MLGKDFVPSCFVDTLFILSPKRKLPAKNSNQGGKCSHDPATTPSAWGSLRVLAPSFHGARATPTSQLYKPKPRAANKMPRGTQLLRARSGTCRRVLLESPGSSDHISGAARWGTERGLVCWLGGTRSCSSATGWSLSVMIPGCLGRCQDTGAEMQRWMLPPRSGKLSNVDIDAPSTPSPPGDSGMATLPPR